MKAIRFFVVLLALSAIVCSCKKYEEGPVISLRSKKARVTGRWKPTSVILYDATGNNFYDSLNVVFDDSLKSYTYEFSNDNKYKQVNTAGVEVYSNIPWDFNSNREKIVLDFSSIGKPIASWSILKLLYSEIWMRKSLGELDGDGGEAVLEVHYERI